LFSLIAINALAALHAYNFTHFTEGKFDKLQLKDLTVFEKVTMLFFGPPNVKSVVSQFPDTEFQNVVLAGEPNLAAWFIPVDSADQTVILCHGYKSEKGSLMERSLFFNDMGYNTLLLDFGASGESEGNQCTIGFKEAEQVSRAIDWVSQNTNDSIVLFGNSMGSVAILKAMADSNINVKALILECPFGSMLETTEARFRTLGAPTFLARLLLFWGGVLNGFWAFDHNPIEYATQVDVPTLLMYGEKDDRVSRSETDRIFSNLNGVKTLATFSTLGHEDYLKLKPVLWKKAVKRFLNGSQY
jgi:alpha-beta hydrolase superfamily lysophospholipase